MQKINLSTMQKLLSGLSQEVLVSAGNVNPYLLEHVICALQKGKKVRYGDLDYDQFEDQDLRLACQYCEDLESVERHLSNLSERIKGAEACAVKQRVFC